MRNDLGDGIRAQRERLGLSLRAVASEIGISASLLSQVETGKLTPSLSTLYQIASYLDVSVDALLGLKTTEDRAVDGEDALRSSVQRAADNPRLEMADGVTWERLATRPESHVEPVVVTFAPGAASAPERKPIRHRGMEFGYLLDGELTMHLRFQQTALRAGDSFMFDADSPHLFVNESSRPARGVWYVAEPVDEEQDGVPGAPRRTRPRVDPMTVLRTSI